MTDLKYAIGQDLWLARFEATEKHVTCEDCGGTKNLRVTLFDGTEHVIECQGCKHGWHGARGYNTVYERTAAAILTRVIGIEMEGEGVTYKTRETWHAAEGDLFPTEAEALVRAAEIAAGMDADEMARLRAKEKPARSWGWHVHYHRSEIRRLEKSLAHHRSQLDVARAKSKEPAATALEAETEGM